MRLLLDECLPRPLKRELVGHEVQTAAEAGLAGLKNGALLDQAAGRFDVFITVDANLRYQQNAAKLRLAVLVLRAASNDMSDLRPLVPAVLAALPALAAGVIVEISE